MSDTTESDKKKGFFINSRSISCIPYRYKRQSYHKETITIKENNIITTNVIEDRQNFKIGSAGRHMSPDGNNIFKNESQIGSVEIYDTDWGTNNRITSEEYEERLDIIERDIEIIKKDIQKLELELNDLKLKINKKY